MNLSFKEFVERTQWNIYRKQQKRNVLASVSPCWRLNFHLFNPLRSEAIAKLDKVFGK